VHIVPENRDAVVIQPLNSGDMGMAEEIALPP
jgi:hypothetical protein